MDQSNTASSHGPTSCNHCYCGNNAVLKQSRTSSNPGRWFWACPERKASNDINGCNFFEWQNKSIGSMNRMLESNEGISSMMARFEAVEKRLTDVEAIKERLTEVEVRLAILEHRNEKYRTQ
ncbi:hypothetical protein QJS10_CPB11g01211 [Acorus calamus]|uniref:GRF-type domain-containing protein n=1 Tax=Acorus calamus TaxID=4465 RepID=A0AAV9DVA3_ACOCL|nr:hypothetical protein QJS10_CPB11g01211 [Acorus calamus]